VYECVLRIGVRFLIPLIDYISLCPSHTDNPKQFQSTTNSALSTLNSIDNSYSYNTNDMTDQKYNSVSINSTNIADFDRKNRRKLRQLSVMSEHTPICAHIRTTAHVSPSVILPPCVYLIFSLSHTSFFFLPGNRRLGRPSNGVS